MSVDLVTYLDSSAIVKLVVREPESGALRRFLRRRDAVVSSAVARVEVHRAVMSLGAAAIAQAGAVLARIDLITISSRVLAEAAIIEPAEVRSLDAVHLATASLLQETLDLVVCYDERMTNAAQSLGWTVHAPV